MGKEAAVWHKEAAVWRKEAAVWRKEAAVWRLRVAHPQTRNALSLPLLRVPQARSTLPVLVPARRPTLPRAHTMQPPRAATHY